MIVVLHVCITSGARLKQGGQQQSWFVHGLPGFLQAGACSVSAGIKRSPQQDCEAGLENRARSRTVVHVFVHIAFDAAHSKCCCRVVVSGSEGFWRCPPCSLCMLVPFAQRGSGPPARCFHHVCSTRWLSSVFPGRRSLHASHVLHCFCFIMSIRETAFGAVLRLGLWHCLRCWGGPG